MRYATKSVWTDFGKWQREAAKAGRIDRVFVGSMMDIFEKDQPVSDWQGNRSAWTLDDLRRRFFTEIVPECPNLFFQLLSKRPGNALKMVPEFWLDRLPSLTDDGATRSLWPKNVITGCSVVDQPTADTLIPQLLKIPGARFLSVEPMLAPIDLKLMTRVAIPKHRESWPVEHVKDFWVIVGGESGHGARPCEIDWVRSIVRQCREAGVMVFVKQLGSNPQAACNEGGWTRIKGSSCEDNSCRRIKLHDGHGGDWDEWPDDLRIRERPECEQEALALATID